MLFVGCLVMFSPPSNAQAMGALYYIHVMSQQISLTRSVELAALLVAVLRHRGELIHIFVFLFSYVDSGLPRCFDLELILSDI